jgi:hypothetical protein
MMVQESPGVKRGTVERPSLHQPRRGRPHPRRTRPLRSCVRRAIGTSLAVLSSLACVAAVVLWLVTWNRDVGVECVEPDTEQQTVRTRWVGVSHGQIWVGTLIAGELRRPQNLSAPEPTSLRPFSRPRQVPYWRAGNSFWNRLGFRRSHEEFGATGVLYWEVRELELPLWLVAMTFAVPPAMLLYRRRRAVQRGRAGQCPACGYDLRATPERCPECGRVIASS